jgi:serine/threonine protein kinase
MSESPAQPPDDDANWPASLRLEHGVFESRYRVLRTLGDGGMGEVVLAQHMTLGKRVAIKIMHPQYRGDTATEQRFIQETRAAARIHHDNVVGISDFGRTADGRMFFVMEYLEGEDLARTLRREGPMPWRRVVHIARQIVRAIGEAHRRGVLHRDIKPGNCFRVTRDGDPDFIKVLDFGLAKLLDDRAVPVGPHTATGVKLGTPGYMAPEILAGQRPDARADLYSIAALMLRLLTGKLRGLGGLAALAEMHELPPPLAKMLHKALQDDPQGRFQSADAMEEALEYVLAASAGHKSGRAFSQPVPAAQPLASRAPEPSADAESGPDESRTPAMTSGVLQPAARPVESRPRARGRAALRPAAPSRWRVVLVSLAVGALIGVGVAVWMHMSQEPDDESSSSSSSPVSASAPGSTLRDPFARQAAQPGES